ncbi:putative membrane protein [Candidatus Zixiibacteriota bacterium]|nr:putative membrane protein [candidate division Zixibacteria bacterium]
MDLKIMLSEHLVSLLIGMALSISIAFISFRLKALTAGGGVGTAIVGTIVFALGGMAAAVPLIIFFVTSSLLSHITPRRKIRALMLADKGKRRDIMQVFANGGIGAICVVLHAVTGNTFWFFCFLASICEAAADTWATEIGTMAASNPVSIISFRKIDPGMSGGITLIGTLAATAGAILVAFGSVPFIGWNRSPDDSLTGPIIASIIAGFAGSIIDSIVGASIQARFRCPVCGKATEKDIHCNRPTVLKGGVRFINNDIVNLLGTLSAAIFVLLFLR